MGRGEKRLEKGNRLRIREDREGGWDLGVLLRFVIEDV
jgi:hypothetical protein